MDAHRGTGDGGVTGEDGGGDVVVLPPDPVDVPGVGERVGVTQPRTGKHDHHRTE